MHLRWTDSAVRDLTHICDYIQEHRSEPLPVVLLFLCTAESNRQPSFPSAGEQVEKPDTREPVFSGLPYLSVYRIHRDTVEIVRILHGA